MRLQAASESGGLIGLPGILLLLLAAVLVFGVIGWAFDSRPGRGFLLGLTGPIGWTVSSRLSAPERQRRHPDAGFRDVAEERYLLVPLWAKLAAATALLSLFLFFMFTLLDFDSEFVLRDDDGNLNLQRVRFILGGVWYAIGVSVAAILLAIVLATFGALGRLSKRPLPQAAANIYTSFVRGTPLLVQIVFWYFALPEVGGRLKDSGVPAFLADRLLLSPVVAGTLALGVNYGAYMTEVFRAGIISVAGGQMEAALSLGMTSRQAMFRIILPQSVRVIIPPVGNDYISMLKDTALLSIITVSEVYFRATRLGRSNSRYLEAITIAAGIYWVLTLVFSALQKRVEERLERAYVR